MLVDELEDGVLHVLHVLVGAEDERNAVRELLLLAMLALHCEEAVDVLEGGREWGVVVSGGVCVDDGAVEAANVVLEGGEQAAELDGARDGCFCLLCCLWCL